MSKYKEGDMLLLQEDSVGIPASDNIMIVHSSHNNYEEDQGFIRCQYLVPNEGKTFGKYYANNPYNLVFMVQIKKVKRFE